MSPKTRRRRACRTRRDSKGKRGRRSGHSVGDAPGFERSSWHHIRQALQKQDGVWKVAFRSTGGSIARRGFVPPRTRYTALMPRASRNEQSRRPLARYASIRAAAAYGGSRSKLSKTGDTTRTQKGDIGWKRRFRRIRRAEWRCRPIWRNGSRGRRPRLPFRAGSRRGTPPAPYGRTIPPPSHTRRATQCALWLLHGAGASLPPQITRHLIGVWFAASACRATGLHPLRVQQPAEWRNR